MSKDEGWMMKRGFEDEQKDKQTFVIVETEICPQLKFYTNEDIICPQNYIFGYFSNF